MVAIRRRKNFFIEGIPIRSKIKVFLVSIFLFLFLLNLTLPVIFPTLNYPGVGMVSIGLSILAIIFSIGSVVAESIILGLLVLAFLSNLWDYGIHDYSGLRNKVLIGTITALVITSFLGKVSLTNLFQTLKRQLGLRK